jgi:hypothetical protein
MISLGVMVGFTAWMMGTKNWKSLIGITILTPVVMFIVFDTLLGVPLPKGFL